MSVPAGTIAIYSPSLRHRGRANRLQKERQVAPPYAPLHVPPHTTPCPHLIPLSPPCPPPSPHLTTPYHTLPPPTPYHTPTHTLHTLFDHRPHPITPYHTLSHSITPCPTLPHSTPLYPTLSHTTHTDPPPLVYRDDTHGHGRRCSGGHPVHNAPARLWALGVCAGGTERARKGVGWGAGGGYYSRVIHVVSHSTRST